MSELVRYLSVADKRERYPKRTIPAILRAARTALADRSQRIVLIGWLQHHGLPTEPGRGDWRMLGALHRAARTGRYRAEKGPQDEVRDVAQTLTRGGDCEDWAAVLLAALALWRAPGVLVTGGDEEDPYKHVWVRGSAGGFWYGIDPKGSQRGGDFDHEAPAHVFPVRKVWRVGR